MRACRLGLCASTGALLPERTKPSAMLHSKVAMLSAEHAVRTRFTARISSDVYITTMGVEELMRTLRRSSPSVIFCDADAVQFRLHARSFAPPKKRLCSGWTPAAFSAVVKLTV